MEGPEWDAQTHSTVKPGRGVEETYISGGGGEVGHHQGFQILWASPEDVDILQISGALSGGGEELVPGKGIIEKDATHPQQGGVSATGVRILF